MKVLVFPPSTIDSKLAEKVFKLRYDVYIDEKHVVARTENAPYKEYRDDYDPFAYQLVAIESDEVVGVGRINFLSDYFIEDYARRYRISELDPLYRENCVVLSRFILRADYRGSRALLALSKETLRTTRSRNSAWAVMSCEDKLTPMFLRIGFEVHAYGIERPAFDGPGASRVYCAMKYDVRQPLVDGRPANRRLVKALEDEQRAAARDPAFEMA
ncbi:MAG: GNAT family N-acyltransferase [Parvularculaceae bacterium]